MTINTRLINKFNSQFTIGAKCYWRSIGKHGVEFETVTVKAPAFETPSGQAVAFFEERKGYCSIEESFLLYDILPEQK